MIVCENIILLNWHYDLDTSDLEYRTPHLIPMADYVGLHIKMNLLLLIDWKLIMLIEVHCTMTFNFELEYQGQIFVSSGRFCCHCGKY